MSLLGAKYYSARQNLPVGQAHVGEGDVSLGPYTRPNGKRRIRESHHYRSNPHPEESTRQKSKRSLAAKLVGRKIDQCRVAGSVTVPILISEIAGKLVLDQRGKDLGE